VNLTVPGTYAIEALGSATIHGVTRPIELNGTIVSTGNNLTLSCQFEIKLVDYQIKIPKIVFAKIAEVIKVSSKLNYTKK
jgi:polyisoprenoid-binding protein YceI